MPKVDWRHLAEMLGTISWTDHGWNEQGSTDFARKAVIHVIGDVAMRDAVDYYVSGQPGFELARHVLWLLRPPAAMERCLEIFRTSADKQKAADAICLLQVVADECILQHVPELLESKNEFARGWAVGILDQLVWTGRIEISQAMPFIEAALTDPYEPVRARAQQILDMQSKSDAS